MITWQNKKIPVFYIYLYKLMREKSHGGIILAYPCVKEILDRKIYNVPRIYHTLILKEMQEFGMIKKVGTQKRFKYELIAKDIEKLLNQYNNVLF